MGKRKKAKGNEVGFKQNKKNREEALLTLDVITARRETEGYVWVRRGTTVKQIHPDKLKAHLEDGWKVSNGKTK